MKISLKDYGWDSFFAEAKKKSKYHDKEHGRVVAVHKSRYEVVTQSGIFSCEILGNIQFQKKDTMLPAVGDWVLLDSYRKTFVIVDILKRKNYLTRQKKHDSVPKGFAANVDIAFIIQSLEGDDFNIKRLERILVHLEKADIRPFLIFNKIDVLDEKALAETKERLARELPHLSSFFISVKEEIGLERLVSYFATGETIIFIGSSGVGKSSLLNRLSQKEQAKTQSVSDVTGKGKHTTSARRLFRLNSGALVIDTPGTREFGMHDEDFAFQDAFKYISELSTQCFFSNCSHGQEKECAVQSAIKAGELSPLALERYLHLQHEQTQSPKEMKISKNSHRGVSRSLRRGKKKKPRK